MIAVRCGAQGGGGRGAEVGYPRYNTTTTLCAVRRHHFYHGDCLLYPEMFSRREVPLVLPT